MSREEIGLIVVFSATMALVTVAIVTPPERNRTSQVEKKPVYDFITTEDIKKKTEKKNPREHILLKEVERKIQEAVKEGESEITILKLNEQGHVREALYHHGFCVGEKGDRTLIWWGRQCEMRQMYIRNRN